MRRTRSRQDDNLGYQKPAPSERLTYREARSCTRWSTCPAPRAPSRVQGHTDLTASPLHQGQALSLLGLLPVATGSVEISFPTASSGRLPPGLQRRAKHAPCTPPSWQASRADADGWPWGKEDCRSCGLDDQTGQVLLLRETPHQPRGTVMAEVRSTLMQCESQQIEWRPRQRPRTLGQTRNTPLHFDLAWSMGIKAEE